MKQTQKKSVNFAIDVYREDDWRKEEIRLEVTVSRNDHENAFDHVIKKGKEDEKSLLLLILSGSLI
jgi:hypothetical protein